MPAPNQVWCGDITYIWAQGKWYYQSVVLDFYARRIVSLAPSEKPDAELVIKALDMAYEQREGLLTCCSIRIKGPICEPIITRAIEAIPHTPEHESTWELLG